MVKRPRRYSNNGHSSGDGDSRTAHRQVGWQGVSKMMISLTAMKTTINKKYNKGGWMGSSSPLQCCSGLRRIGRGPPRMGTKNDSSVALEDEDMEDDNVEDNGNECRD